MKNIETKQNLLPTGNSHNSQIKESNSRAQTRSSYSPLANDNYRAIERTPMMGCKYKQICGLSQLASNDISNEFWWTDYTLRTLFMRTHFGYKLTGIHSATYCDGFHQILIFLWSENLKLLTTNNENKFGHFYTSIKFTSKSLNQFPFNWTKISLAIHQFLPSISRPPSSN